MTNDQIRHASAITVINLKGGVGKTHTAWLLASICQERGLKVLVIDTDTQANFTSSFLDPAQTVPGVERLFHPGAEQSPLLLVRRTRYPNIDVLPSSAALARFDLADQREWERADLHLSLVDPIRELRPHYDYVQIDCPPRLSLASFASLCASDGVIIPMEAADWGAQGIMQVTAAIEYVQQRFSPRLRLLGYLVSRFKRARSYQQSYLRRLREHFGALAFDTVIPDLSQFEKCHRPRPKSYPCSQCGKHGKRKQRLQPSPLHRLWQDFVQAAQHRLKPELQQVRSMAFGKILYLDITYAEYRASIRRGYLRGLSARRVTC